jgi:hypothetical protein
VNITVQIMGNVFHEIQGKLGFGEDLAVVDK